MTLTGILESLGVDKSPLQPLGDDEWYLSSELYIEDGITLEIHGTPVGGDCDYLKLKSDDESHVYIRAYGGSLDIVNTKVTSWDNTTNDVDTDFVNGRAYISAISEVIVDPSAACQGFAKENKGEARMDVENSEIAFMGYDSAEAYGYSYKTRGLCSDLSNLEDYEDIGVYGNILNSDLHHLYYGHYSYGHINGVFIKSKVHDNIVYGFDPHHGSRGLTIEDNEVYNNGNHGIIFSKRCTDAVVKNNHVHDNVGVGIFAHWLGDRTRISGNLVENNQDSGIAFLESNNAVVTGNMVVGNVHGIRFSVGSRDNIVLENSFEDNSGWDVYMYMGNDPVVEVPDGRPTNNIVFRNKFSGNPNGFRFDDSSGCQFVENEALDAETFEVNDSEYLLVSGNVLVENIEFDVSGSCVEISPQDPCGDDPMEPFTDATVLGTIDEVTLATTSPFISDQDTNTPTESPSYYSLFTSQPTVRSVSSFSPSSSPTSSPTGDIISSSGPNILSPTQSQSAPTLGLATTSESTTGILLRRTTIVLMVTPTLLVLLFA